jgi:hypothetical protein
MFFKDITTSIDQSIQSSMYPGMESEADGIDLRIEMNRILYGSTFKKPLGHWVVVRVYDVSSRSKYFNQYSREGILGPAHKYTDYLVRSRRVSTHKTANELDIIKPNDVVDDGFTYYFEWTVPVNAGSQIYEIDAKDHAVKPTTYKLLEKYDVVKTLPYRLENGNVQYISAITESDNVTY